MTSILLCPDCQFTHYIPEYEGSTPDEIRSYTRETCPICGQPLIHGPDDPTPCAFDDKPEIAICVPGPENSSPWENPSAGIVKRLISTFNQVLFTPTRMFRKLSIDKGIAEPMSFGLFSGTLGIMFSLFWNILIIPDDIISLTFRELDPVSLGFTSFILFLVIPMCITAFMFLYSGVLHILLVVARGGNKGYEATFRVVSYSQAVQLLNIIPFIGGIIGMLLQLPIQIIGLREIHGMSYWRITLAFFIPFIFIFMMITGAMITGTFLD